MTSAAPFQSRLTIGRKLALIGAMFAVPLAFLVYSLVAEKNIAIHFLSALTTAQMALQRSTAARLDEIAGVSAAGSAPAGADQNAAAAIEGITSAARNFSDVPVEPALIVLVSGPPGQAPIDRTLGLLAQMSTQLGAMSDSVGGAAALQEVKSGGGGGAARAIEIEAAQLPPSVAGILGPLAGSSQALVRTQASGELAQLYKGEVVAECNAIVAGRYPYAKGAAGDVPVADFARLFGYGGVYDTFFKTNLAQLIDTTRSPWRWRQAGDGSMGLPASIPVQFEAVDKVRQQYFRQGAADPEVRFTLMPESLDADVQRFVLEAGGQSFEYAHGPQARWALKWPSDTAQMVVATFDTGAGRGPI
jgi:type VI secretion system protein ImpL